MIQNFANIGTENIFNGKNTKIVRKLLPSVLLSVARRKLDQLDSVSTMEELKVPPGKDLNLCLATEKVYLAYE